MEGQLAFGMPCTPAVASGLPDYIYTPAHPDEHIVWEGGSDIATCNSLADAKRVAQAIRCSGSKACIWISNGPEFDTVFTEPNI
ncbi:hypothetical protein LMG32289_06235 [Cupriavidus pampae]|uniref:DUF4189 domain-containing protein n=2 Tax=Cupriavidus pampae TaxID=659251 RepID=A0ABN7ZJT1_9BURK|nr:hypothetical protein LMG32289_06235 [Cupriavidus pampae]